MLGNPSDVGHAMTLADSADSAMWFSGSWQRQLHHVPSRPQNRRENHGGPRGNNGYAPMELGAATAAAAAAEGFVGSVTCAVKLGICVGIAPKLRARVSRSRQKTPEACTEGVTRAFF